MTIKKFEELMDNELMDLIEAYIDPQIFMNFIIGEIREGLYEDIIPALIIERFSPEIRLKYEEKIRFNEKIN